MSKSINNPILPGFHPDPTIVKDGDDYYLATSTFEWYPGVCIYHSKDLAQWQLVDRPLNSLEFLDMRGNPDSCGVWAPCLTVKDGIFYLAFTNTRRFAGNFKDTPNYYISTDKIGGRWLQPTYVNSSGFDPSLFHDTDGKSYWLNMLWDHRPAQGRNNFAPNTFFAGIVCQQIDLEQGKLIGDAQMIYSGSSIGLTEGPHIKKRGNYYYLITAEGGTGPQHAVSVARSTSVFGPYETDPQNPLITSALTPDAGLKRAGHGDWVELGDNKGALVHLCSRPLPFRGRSVLGRETALHFFEWSEDGWPCLSHGNNAPLPPMSAATMQANAICEAVDFASEDLPTTYHSLRYPISTEDAYHDKQGGYFCLRGQESIGSHFQQSLLARRQQAFRFNYSVSLDFSPTSFQQMAGLTCYYNGQKFFYLHVTHVESIGRVLEVAMCSGEWTLRYPLAEPIKLPEIGTVELRAMVDHDNIRFAYKHSNLAWQTIDLRLDYSIMCDELGDGGADANFTGCFVGFCCQDLTGQRLTARFNNLRYQEHNGQD